MKTYRFTLTLIPQNEASLPNFLGEAIRAAFLKVLQLYNPELSEYLHRGNEIREYAIGPVFNGRRKFHGQYGRKRDNKITVSPSTPLKVPITLVGEELATSFVQGVLNLESAILTLFKNKMMISEIKFEAQPVLDFVKGDNLPTPSKINLHFLSPTQFSSRGSKYPILFPIVTFLFGNAVTLWNSLIPDLKMDRDNLYQFVSANIYVRAHRLYTREVALLKKYTFTGFEGWTQLIVVNPSDEFASYILPLLKLCELLNIGKERSIGLGCLKVSIPQLEKGEKLHVQ
ncbi:MAG: CRISPR system precrRNA processing endoribonuclease RAMP protein Cas6 [Candidatus Hodarchaeota archaeon]